MAQSFSITSFKGAMSRPARSHLFNCKITCSSKLAGFSTIFNENFGAGASVATKSLLCRAATIPEMVVDVGELYFFTRAVKYPSRRTFAPLTLTFYNTEDYELRYAFEQWNGLLNSYRGNMGVTFDSEGTDTLQSSNGILGRANDITGTITLTPHSVTEFSADGVTPPSYTGSSPLYTYKFVEAFPSSIGALSFSYDNDAEIQTFDVTFQYNYMKGE